MDDFIIDRIELLMGYSRISPFTIAKFLICSPLILYCILYEKEIIQLHSVKYIVMLCIVMFIFYHLYNRIRIVEIYNNRLFENNLRYEVKHMRKCMLILLPLFCVLIILNATFFIPLVIATIISLLYLYLISINWVKPANNILKTSNYRRRKVITKTKRRAF